MYEGLCVSGNRRGAAAGEGNKEGGLRYAVKRIRRSRIMSRRQEAFFREASILNALEHENVVKIHQIYRRDPGYHYMVLEHLGGGELFDRIAKKKSYNEREARDVCKVLVDVIAHLHERNIVHRGLKPGSILLASPANPTVKTTTTETDSVDGDNVTTTTTTTVTVATTNSKIKVTDFSMACRVSVGGLESVEGDVDEFKAPEILLEKPYGKPADMWTVGLIAYMLLNGDHPFLEADRKKMFLRVAAGDCRFKPEDWIGVSDHAKGFIRELLKVDADGRMTAEQARDHPWMLADGSTLEAHDLHNNLEQLKVFQAKRKLRAMLKTVLAVQRLLQAVQPLPPPPPPRDFHKSYTIDEHQKLGEGSFGTVFKAASVGTCSPAAPADSGSAVPRSWVPSMVSRGGGRRGSGASAAAAAAAAAAATVDTTPRFFAVKRISKEGLEDQGRRDIINEVKIMRQLDHPNVVSIHDFFAEEPKYFYMVLEYMEGRELFSRIVKKEYYNEAEARDVCVNLLRAVEYIHSQGFVHRDLKPENLLLASPHDDASIGLADFGFASSVRDGFLTNACGTPAYVAPEMLKRIPYGTSVDMWSIGVIIYLLLAGYPPFEDRDQRKMFRAIKMGHFRFHDKYWSEVSEGAKDLIRKLLTVDPDKRITASEACEHSWLSKAARPSLSDNNLSAGLEQLKKFNALRKLRCAIKTVRPRQRRVVWLSLQPCVYAEQVRSEKRCIVTQLEWGLPFVHLPGSGGSERHRPRQDPLVGSLVKTCRAYRGVRFCGFVRFVLRS
ncbi:unnamed protein product [Scytosiphon promiscuus]